MKMISESELDQNMLTVIQGKDKLVNHEIFKSSVRVDALDLVIQRALADFTGCLNFGGYSGDKLRDRMLYFTKLINPSKTF